MTRTDEHRPSAIVPADYDFVAFEYLRCDDLGTAMFLQRERERIRAHMTSTGGTYSSHEHGGNCAVCGSVNAVYTALFHHRPSNVYVRTGLECAEKLECSGVESFRRQVRTALEQKAGKRKAQAVLEVEGLAQAWTIYTGSHEAAEREAIMAGQSLGWRPSLAREESTVCDIVGRLVQYGSISDKAMAYLHSLVSRINNREQIAAQRAAETAAAAPVPVNGERITVRGKVLSIRKPDYDRGECGPVRMLVQHAAGWKVWGSVPVALDGIERGAEVEFSATVKRSDKDTKFGFFTRPTKAHVV